MAVDSLGYADIVGVASGVNLPQVNPTQTCVRLSSADGTEFNAFLIRFDGGGDLIQSSYLQALVNAGPGSIPVLPQAMLSVTAAAGTGVLGARLECGDVESWPRHCRDFARLRRQCGVAVEHCSLA